MIQKNTLKKVSGFWGIQNTAAPMTGFITSFKALWPRLIPKKLDKDSNTVGKSHNSVGLILHHSVGRHAASDYFTEEKSAKVMVPLGD